MKNRIKVFFLYHELIERYDKILTSTSRGFENNYDFLDVWMPGSNQIESIVNFFEAAKLYDQKNIGLEILDYDNLINLEKLKNTLKKIGNFNFIVENDRLKIY